MILRKRTFLWLGGYLLIGVVVFLLTAQAAPQPSNAPPMFNWLKLSSAQREAIQQQDPSFETDAAALGKTVSERRAALATLLENPDSTNEQILAQIDQVNEAEHALEKRVINYLLAVREHLTTDQQLRMMGLAANCVRGRGHGYRGGEGGGQGQGPGYGQGQGGGSNRGWHGGR